MKDAASDTITVKVPIAFRRHPGRKRVVAPEGGPLTPLSCSEGEIDNALVNAIARAHRWQRMLESGDHGTLRDPAYVSRVLRLTLLSPALVEEACNRNCPTVLTLRMLAIPFSIDWCAQEKRIVIIASGQSSALADDCGERALGTG